MKERYTDMDSDALSFEDFYTMSEQFLPHRGLPVLFRDVLYNLVGYVYATGDSPEETLSFYKRMITDNSHYVKRKEDMQFYMDQGCHPDCMEIAPLLYGRKEHRSSRKEHSALSKTVNFDWQYSKTIHKLFKNVFNWITQIKLT